MLRVENGWNSTKNRPKDHRRFVPLVEYKHFSKLFGRRYGYREKKQMFVIPGKPVYKADVHDFGVLPWNNWSDKDQIDYHEVRRRSLRPPEKDVLIGYQYDWRDFTKYQQERLVQAAQTAQKMAGSIYGFISNQRVSLSAIDPEDRKNIFIKKSITNFLGINDHVIIKPEEGCFYGDPCLGTGFSLMNQHQPHLRNAALNEGLKEQVRLKFKSPNWILPLSELNSERKYLFDKYWKRLLYCVSPQAYVRFVSSNDPRYPERPIDISSNIHSWFLQAQIFSGLGYAVLSSFGIASRNWIKSNVKFHDRMKNNKIYLDAKEVSRELFNEKLKYGSKYFLKKYLNKFIFGWFISGICMMHYVDSAKAIGRTESGDTLILMKNQLSDFAVPFFATKFLLNIRRGGLIKASLVATVYTIISSIPFLIMAHANVLPWQIYRELYVQTCWEKYGRNQEVNYTRNTLLFTRILEELSTNRTFEHGINTEVYNTLITPWVRDMERQNFKATDHDGRSATFNLNFKPVYELDN